MECRPFVGILVSKRLILRAYPYLKFELLRLCHGFIQCRIDRQITQ